MSFQDVVCLITLLSESRESYMFHVPNIEVTGKQAEAIGLPLVQRRTRGEKEKELADLKKAISVAKADFILEGIVTGAVKSIYQSTRVQRICRQLDLWCFNPLWLKDEIELLNDVVKSGFEVIISGVFAFPLDKKFLGRKLDSEMIQKLEGLRNEYGLSPAGEGGEIETTVTDAPFFRKRLEITDYEISYKDYSGVFRIKDLRLIDK
jgi:ABC transporter with metal-binding/Fe-S-binding domain ATP-binding protein